MNLAYQIFIYYALLVSSSVCASSLMDEENSKKVEVNNGLSDFDFQRFITQELQEFIASEMKNSKAPAVSLAFSFEGKNYQQAFGYADIKRKKRARVTSSYRLASVGKIITAVAILQLVEKRKIDLDVSILKYLPDFPQDKKEITVRHLLAHLSGISHYRSSKKSEIAIKKEFSTQQSINIFKDWPLLSNPGEEYHYSSYAYNILGYIVEKVSGQSFGEYLEEHIFQKAGMSDTYLEKAAQRKKNWVIGYKLKNNKLRKSNFVNISSRFAGGGLRSTVLDMRKFATNLMADRFLSKKTRESMAHTSFLKGVATNYGLGMASYTLLGRPVLGHIGGQPETTTLLLIYPVSGLKIALATNLEDQTSLLYAIAGKISQRLLQAGRPRVAMTARTKQSYYWLQTLNLIYEKGISSYFLNRPQLSIKKLELRDKFTQVNKLLEEGLQLFSAEEVSIELENAYLKKSLSIDAGGTKNTSLDVGIEMAKTLQAHYGRDHLKSYFMKGAIPFYYDYLQVCKQENKPKKLNSHKKMCFSKNNQNKIEFAYADWKKMQNTEILNFVKKVAAQKEFYDLLSVRKSPQMLSWLDESNYLSQTFKEDFVYDISPFLLKRAEAHIFNQKDPTKNRLKSKRGEFFKIFSHLSSIYPNNLDDMFLANIFSVYMTPNFYNDNKNKIIKSICKLSQSPLGKVKYSKKKLKYYAWKYKKAGMKKSAEVIDSCIITLKD